MSKKLEIKQIAEELALSSTTVSRALSGKAECQMRPGRGYRSI